MQPTQHAAEQPRTVGPGQAGAQSPALPSRRALRHAAQASPGSPLGQPLRDWALPEPWQAQRDLSVLGEDAGFFEDTLGVLAEPGGAVSVALHHGPLPDAVAAVAQRRARHRPPPNLLLERRALRYPARTARSMLAGEAGPTAALGQPERRTATVGSYQVILTRTRPWLAAGPGVRISAVVVLDGVRDALVLTMTWDDEYGMEALDALMLRTIERLTVQIDPPGQSQQLRPPHGGTRRTAGKIPGEWNGISTRPAQGAQPVQAVAQGLIMAERRLFGTGYRVACVVIWVLAITLLVPLILAPGTSVAAVTAVAVLSAACALPYLLAWRSWTLLHGLVTDQEDRTTDLPPERMRPIGLWYYLATAAILGAGLFGTLATGSFTLRSGPALPAWLVGHLLLIAVEHLRPFAPRLRRWWQTRASRRFAA